MKLLPLTINSPSTAYMQMPRWLFNEDIDLSIEAKFLYMLIYDAASVSKKNNHIATDGTLYVWYTLKTVQEKMKCSKKTAIKMFCELEEKGYIQRKKQGLGRPSIIYLYYPDEAMTIKTNSTEEEAFPSPTKVKKAVFHNNNHNGVVDWDALEKKLIQEYGN